ncbi:KH domain-containing protein [Candidatus Daviesbacteria bacterium]|nr:KH domain-containing protein [Candidatus Daviesbacteria bacterium]
MEQKVSEILENILSMLSLEGSFEVEEKNDGVFVSIDASEPGRLIGRDGQTLQALQFIINQIILKHTEDPKRVILDVSGWRQGKEEELAHKTKQWAEQVIEEGKPLELEPMPAWQRRVVHITIEEMKDVESESVGEGLDRHLVISPVNVFPKN